MNPARFAMMYDGKAAKMVGMVYDCFDEDLNSVEPFELPYGTKVWAGIDWGYTQPFVCCIVAKLPTGRYVLVSEVYQSRMGISEIVEVLKQRQKIWDIVRFYAGPDQPGHIKELNRAGLPCTAADNDVKAGIDAVYSVIQEGRFQVFKGKAPNICNEFESYHWPQLQDLKPDQDEKDPNPVKQDDHGCFIAGTLIETADGPRPIELIQSGDSVITPFGPRVVQSAGTLGYKSVINVILSNGDNITCTPDHPFYGFRKGFDEIRSGTIISQWNNRKSPILMGKNILGMVNITALLVAVLMAARDCIVRFGSSTMVKYQKAITYITEMALLRTMISPTWNASPLLSTRLSIGKIAANGAEQSDRYGTCKKSRSWPKNGIAQRRVVGGISAMGKTSSETSPSESWCAKFAGKVTRQKSHLLPVFARTIVGLSTDAKVGWMMFKNSAQFATSLLLSTNIKPPKEKPVAVSAVQNINEKQKVYNLKLDAGCYYANGILVSNCDALRYCLISIARKKKDRHKMKQPAKKTGEEFAEKRLKRLKSKRNTRHETW